MRKQITGICLIILCCVCVLPGCMSAQKLPSTQGKSITVAVSSDTGSMDPAGSIALTFLTYSAASLDELVTFDEEGNIEYRAAEFYEVNEDKTVWTFHLRENALWSNGKKVTAADFLNTMTRALDPESGSGYANYLFPIRNAQEIYNGEMSKESLGVETPDEYTLIFHLEEPCGYFLDLLRLPVYLPSCVSYADSALSGWDKEEATSVANGPFCLAKYEPKQYLLLEKNENYWNEDAISLDSILFRFFDDQQSMANAYETGEVDVATSLLSTVMELYEGEEDLVVSRLG